MVPSSTAEQICCTSWLAKVRNETDSEIRSNVLVKANCWWFHDFPGILLPVSLPSGEKELVTTHKTCSANMICFLVELSACKSGSIIHHVYGHSISTTVTTHQIANALCCAWRAFGEQSEANDATGWRRSLGLGSSAIGSLPWFSIGCAACDSISPAVPSFHQHKTPLWQSRSHLTTKANGISVGIELEDIPF